MTDKPKTPKAPKKPKPIPPEKRILETIQNLFLKPDMRRSAYLYCGFKGIPKNCFVFGSAPKEMQYGNPKESLYMVHVKDPQMVEDVHAFFERFHIDTSKTEIISFAPLVSVVQKHKLDESVSTYRNTFDELMIQAPSLECDRVLTQGYDSLFLLDQFASITQGFVDTLLGKREVETLYYPISENDPKETLYYIVIPHANFEETPIGAIFPSNIRVLLSRGLDWLVPKPLLKSFTIKQQGLEFWPFSGSTLRYAYCIRTEQADFLGARCNVLLIPDNS